VHRPSRPNPQEGVHNGTESIASGDLNSISRSKSHMISASGYNCSVLQNTAAYFKIRSKSESARCLDVASKNEANIILAYIYIFNNDLTKFMSLKLITLVRDVSRRRTNNRY
jgi:hypothetical protein